MSMSMVSPSVAWSGSNPSTFERIRDVKNSEWVQTRMRDESRAADSVEFGNLFASVDSKSAIHPA